VGSEKISYFSPLSLFLLKSSQKCLNCRRLPAVKEAAAAAVLAVVSAAVTTGVKVTAFNSL
jgi:hypothetical protein